MAREIGWQETKILFFVAVESTQDDQNRVSEDWERVGRGSGPYDVTNRAECLSLCNLVPRVLSLPPSRKYPGFGWSRVSLKQTAPFASSRSEGKSECKSFQTRTDTEEWKSLAHFFSKTGTLKKYTVYYLRCFRTTNDADFPSTKYFTVGSICFEFAEGV